jgi:hypothetical protein
MLTKMFPWFVFSHLGAKLPIRVSEKQVEKIDSNDVPTLVEKIDSKFSAYVPT